MSNTSTPPSSVSSVSSSRRSTRPPSSAHQTPKKSQKGNEEPPRHPGTPTSTTQSSSIVEGQEDDDDYTVTTTTTIVTTTTARRSATPQPSSAHLLNSPRMASRLQTPPSSPVKGRAYRASAASSPSFSPAAFPTAPPSSYSPSKRSHGRTQSTSLRSPTQSPGVAVFGPLRYYIPHPDKIQRPVYTHTPPKMYYAVTVGQDVGVFDDWLLVSELIHQVTGARYKGYKTWDEALERYAGKYFSSAMHRLPHPGSRFNEPLPDWEDQEFVWDDEHEEAARQLEEQR